MPQQAENSSEIPLLRHSFHDSIHLIHREDWEAVAKDASLYLQYDHLCALEDAMAGSMEFRYVIFHCSLYRPVGVAYFQILDLEDNGSSYGDAVRKLGAGIGSRIIKELKVRSLVCGNVLHSGDHGSHFVSDIPKGQQLVALEIAMELLRTDERLRPKVSVLMFKDVFPELNGTATVLEERGYHPLAMDVNMVMDVDPNWSGLTGYVEALNAKARTRIKAIMDRSSEIFIKDLSVEEIKRYASDMQRLFDQVLDRSPFVFGRLNVEVYVQWKAQLGDKLMFHGFFLKEELVAFNSAFVLGDALDAQFVGLDHDRNQAHMIYQRILVDLLAFAMDNKLRSINFGRTAEQAKSSIGATPISTLFYVKHQNKLANRVIGPFIRKIKVSEFEQRSPFKKVKA